MEFKAPINGINKYQQTGTNKVIYSASDFDMVTYTCGICGYYEEGDMIHTTITKDWKYDSNTKTTECPHCGKSNNNIFI